MVVALKIKDETPLGELISESILQFPVARISVKELIEQRVEKEVFQYNSSSAERFHGLVQPTEFECELNDVRLRKEKRIDVVEQKCIAVEAFSRNRFFLLVNDKQLTRLDDEILITPNTTVTFLKLVPLVGG